MCPLRTAVVADGADRDAGLRGRLRVLGVRLLDVDLWARPGQASLLQRAVEKGWGSTFVSALAQGGVDGTLTGVSSLSGYVRDASGRLLVSSILMNANGRTKASARGLQDRVVQAVAG